jgi:adenylate cyclase
LRQVAKDGTVTVGGPSKSTVATPRNIADFPVLYSELLPLAWVAFSDVVNFTTMCRFTPAKLVISVLNELFSLLDVESQNFGVEKIKTIGDGFMCAKLTTSELHSAIDEATRTRNVSRDGIEMVQFLLRAMQLAKGVDRPMPAFTQRKEAFEEEPCPHLELRVGLHAGPVASGIVGFERPLYDLFGDTVNTAARLESSGKPGKIQVMETTTQYFDEALRHLEFENDVHTVELKGIGQASTRFIVGCRKDDAMSNMSRQSRQSKQSKQASRYADK